MHIIEKDKRIEIRLDKSKIDLLYSWTQTQIQLAKLKRDESVIRKKVVQEIFGKNKKGTRELVLSESHSVKISANEEYKLDTEKTNEFIIALYEKLNCEEVAQSICDELFSYSYKINKKYYDNAPQWLKDMLKDALTIKLGAASMKYISPDIERENDE